MCYQQYRLWDFAEKSWLSRQYPEVYKISVIYYDRGMDDLAFVKHDTKELKSRLRKEINCSDIIEPIIGNLEYDYLEETKLFIPHFHLLVMADKSSIKRLYNSFLKPNKKTQSSIKLKQPVHVSHTRINPKLFVYNCSSYDSPPKPKESNKKKRGIKFGVDLDQMPLILRVYDRVGFRGLSFYYGVRRIGSRLVVKPI